MTIAWTIAGFVLGYMGMNTLVEGVLHGHSPIIYRIVTGFVGGLTAYTICGGF